MDSQKCSGVLIVCIGIGKTAQSHYMGSSKLSAVGGKSQERWGECEGGKTLLPENTQLLFEAVADQRLVELAMHNLGS
ncbi:hypothetical protein Tco_0963074 [Tanacetum coccineum]